MLRHSRGVLAVLALAQFMVILDVTIVNVALPDIQSDLDFSTSSLQWVIGAYTLVFGGFLLLGGRAGDLLGRRRVFMVGLGLFGAASLAAGLAVSDQWLIALRALQGLGGAILSPAAFSILTVTFAHGRDRNIAMGVWGGLAGLGGTLGVILGGFLVDSLGWRWIFLVNVPLAIALIAISPLVLKESRTNKSDAPRGLDIPGALTSTLGLLALMLAVIRAEPLGWGSGEVVALLIAAVLLLALFVFIELRTPAPLVPMHLFRSRGLSLATISLALNGGGFLAMFFLTALYLQDVRDLSALRTGVYFLPMGVAAIIGAVVASQLVTRVGTRPVQLGGVAFSLAGLLLLSNAGSSGSYAADLLPGFVLFGVGIVSAGVPAQVTAVAEVTHEHAGAASGVVSAGYQVGGALGLAVIVTLSTSFTTDKLADGLTPTVALNDGFQYGLLAAAVLAGLNLAVTLASPHLHPTAEQVAEAAVG